MRSLGISRPKRILFSIIPLFGLVLTGELVCRVKFFLLHDYDWNYLAAPFPVHDIVAMDHGLSVPPADLTGSARGQTVIRWHQWCGDHEVWSDRYGMWLPYTYDDNCFRGDHVSLRKPADEYRIFVLGGSTVEGTYSDTETMTTRLKEGLPRTYRGKRVEVVNAGHSSYGSEQILRLYQVKVQLFSPDVVLRRLEAYDFHRGRVSGPADRGIACDAARAA